MERVGSIEPHGYDIYYADSRFSQPGLWAWDGERQILILSEEELRKRMTGWRAPRSWRVAEAGERHRAGDRADG